MLLHFTSDSGKRKDMVKAIEQRLGIPARYLGMPTAAYVIGSYRVNRDGSLEFDVNTGTDESSDVIDACVMAGFEPLEWDKNEDTAEEGTDLTVTIPRDSITDEELERVRLITDSKAGLIRKALGADSLPIEDDGENVSFPWTGADPTPEEYGAATCLITGIIRLAKELKRVSAKEKEYDNEKYAFRCFLLRLGMVGKEYKTVRKTLLKNFEGSSSFKSGAKKGGAQ